MVRRERGRPMSRQANGAPDFDEAGQLIFKPEDDAASPLVFRIIATAALSRSIATREAAGVSVPLSELETLRRAEEENHRDIQAALKKTEGR
jgi:hypothetical protein